MTTLSTSVLDAVPDGLVVSGPDQTIWALNQTAAAMLAVDCRQALGQPLATVLRLRDSKGRDWCETHRPYGGLVMRTGIPEQSWTLPDGREVLVTARLVREDRLGPVSQVGICLRSGRWRARLDRDRSDLVATLAHELRSPLTGVKGFVQALINRWDRLTDDQKLLMLHTVNTDADRLSRLIAELLDVARLDTGLLSLHPVPCDVATLISRATAGSHLPSGRTVVFAAAGEKHRVWADPDRFTQVIANLIDNGLRHGEGTVTVDVSAETDGWLTILVRDQGAGIDPDVRGRVFTKFWRGGVRGGSGLGLYLVNGLTRAHGGAVEITDAPGGGAQISLTWPTDPPLEED